MPSPNLLHAIAHDAGGKVVIVAGAGCSVEAPTCLPMAWRCSLDAHQKLIDDHILIDGECNNPSDLSCLADTVKVKCGCQSNLVGRLPVDGFKRATPNNGHLFAIALMVEGAIAHIVTLNFDLAFSNALSELSVSGITTIKGPEQHNDFGLHSIIYLHRSAEADPKEWVLTTDSLNNAWQGQWEEVIASMAATIPYTVFAGIGSSCGVLTHSVNKILGALGQNKEFVIVDICNPGESKFIAETGITHDKCEQTGWVDFMSSLAERYKQRLFNEIEQLISQIWNAVALKDPVGLPLAQSQGLTQKLAEYSLVELAAIRSRWSLATDAYRKSVLSELRLVAEALLAIDAVERVCNAPSVINENSSITVGLPNNRQLQVLLVCGVNGLRWSELDHRIEERLKYTRKPRYTRGSNKVIAVTIQGPKLSQLSPPRKIVDAPEQDDIISGSDDFMYLDVDELRASPEKIKELLS
ncbi:MAG TPA: hypothetical protein PKA76_18590 [Pirellulaceae bacterium]|nr:hypothetical protein [Pirellulaceae bacterium]